MCVLQREGAVFDRLHIVSHGFPDAARPGHKITHELGRFFRVMPSMSCITNTWPSVDEPAPIPITGVRTVCASRFPSALGMHSTRIMSALSSECLGVFDQSITLFIAAALHFVAPEFVDRSGVSGPDGHTRESSLTEQGNGFAQPVTPSSLTRCAPAAINRAALSIACSGVA